MISLSSVTKRFGPPTGGVTAVNTVNFKAQTGEIIGFLGPNGAGKTTTMRLILGYLYPTEGKILVNDSDPLENRIELLKQVGYLPENNPLYQEMGVSEYLNFISAVKGADGISEVVSHVGLQEVLSKKIEELSRGFKQRVGLAAALLGNPDILILDEPTSGLDPLEQEKIKNLIKGLAKKKTVIFSTHILSEVEDVATKLIIINKGKIVYDGAKPKGSGAVGKLFKKLIKE
jgi:ABC-2 type transport system ATP-binding protein